eukprot:scaffold30130_cov58-Attheya_sp.AAC.3
MKRHPVSQQSNATPHAEKPCEEERWKNTTSCLNAVIKQTASCNESLAPMLKDSVHISSRNTMIKDGGWWMVDGGWGIEMSGWSFGSAT